MHQKLPTVLVFFAALCLAQRAGAQQTCFTAEERARAEQTAKVWHTWQDHSRCLRNSGARVERRHTALSSSVG